MYTDILGLTYSELKIKYSKFESINSIRKIVTFKNTEEVDTYSATSDIIVYYDIVADSTPLLFVERVLRTRLIIIKIKHFVRKLNRKLEGYVATINSSENKKYIDIVIIKGNIHTNAVEGHY